ncbi:MAG TPA: hypothetical protein VJ772_06405 [Nitrososphaeraceae archaeon]|nr:hypothetical protein [Nitrososphaeraceae archaeon]
MTSEILQFKCPSCGQKLTEEEYWHVCQVQKNQLDNLVKKEVAQKVNQIEQEMKKKNEIEKNKTISRIVNEEKLRLQKEHEAKQRQLELEKAENVKLIDQKVSQAIVQIETRYKQKEKESELKNTRILSINKELADKVEKLEKALDNVPPELRGTAGELVLQDELQKEFITDKFVSKKVGFEMADIIQTIVTEHGKELRTPIAYDKKMGNCVTKLDIDKAIRYKTVHNTDHVIIVTSKGIRNNRFTEKREGIMLVHPFVLLDVARAIRSLIIETAKYEKSSEALKEAEAKIYNYVTSPEYNREWEIILQMKSQLNELQTVEDRRQKQTSEKRSTLLNTLYKLISKNHSIISDMLQRDGKRENESG